MAVIAFPILVLVQCSMFFVLPFLVPIITGVAVALYGVVLSTVVLRHFLRKQQRVRPFLIGLIAVTWLGWVFLPTKEFAVHVRFWLEQSQYNEVVAQIDRGERPDCLTTHDCILEGDVSPYVIFPFPGFLTGWIGVVHVPELDRGPNPERLKSIASDPGCDPDSIAPHYYVCVFY